jgi:hypothetical protein
LIKAAGNLTLNASNSSVTVLSTDQRVHIYNNSAASITIIQGTGMTLRLVGTATTGTRTLAQRGYATIVMISSTEAVALNCGGLT